jgi:hypothetical protein
MDLNRLTRDADDLIRKVVSRYNQLYVPAGTISQLELDLMLDDLRKLYDTFKNIGHINLTLQNPQIKPEVKVNTSIPTSTQYAAPGTTVFEETPVSTSETKQNPVQTMPVQEVIAEVEYKQEVKSEPEHETIQPADTEEDFVTESEFEPEPVREIPEKVASVASELEKPVQENSGNSQAGNSETVPTMLADKFNTGNKSLSETMASSQIQGVMGSRMLFQPIADLNTGIGLNDKFSFISDLFGNNVDQYNEAITRINKAVNLDEANWILQKYLSTEWEHKHESLARLKDFVKRRFV